MGIKSLKNDSVGLAPLKEGTTLVTDAQKKSEILLKEFSSVFLRDDSQSVPWLGPASNKMMDIVVHTEGVEKLLSTLQPHKASGPDRIPNRVLKELASEVAPAITAIFNQTLSTGTIPSDWSKALVTPIYKKGNIHSPANYRPVSLTTVTCKILEHIICTNILAHMEKHEMLSSVQHGFRKTHSCESQLLTTLDDFYTSYDAKIQTDVGVLDFSRAFDTVPHQRLLGKLAHYGIQGTTLGWIEAFLTGRSMRVIVDGEESGSAPVTSGVPQGSVLGPLLFNIFINDMPKVVTEGTKIRLFADDCLAYKEIKTPDDQQTLQKDLTSLQLWAERWGMKFNPSKCNIMHISRTKPISKYYEICGQILSTVDSAKYLGVTITSDLAWHEQASYAAKKANSALHLVSRNLKHCSRATRATAYLTLVRPKLEYCASVWDPYKKEDIQTLEMVNRRAARSVYKKSWYQRDVSPTALLQELEWPTLQERRQRLRLCMLYKILNGLIAVPPSRLKKPVRETRGHSKKLCVIGSTCEAVRNSFYVRTIPEWNSLNEQTVSASSLTNFKKELLSSISA